jgi:hypothetical protein
VTQFSTWRPSCKDWHCLNAQAERQRLDVPRIKTLLQTLRVVRCRCERKLQVEAWRGTDAPYIALDSRLTMEQAQVLVVLAMQAVTDGELTIEDATPQPATMAGCCDSGGDAT